MNRSKKMDRSVGAAILGAVLAFGIAPASNAKVYPVETDSGVNFIGFAPHGSFTDQFSFSLAGDSIVSGNFTKFLINQVQLSFKAISDSTWTPVTKTNNGVLSTFTLGSGALDGGDYQFRVSGVGLGPKFISFRPYGGTLAVAPVPEPETWAMLTVGSLLVGYQLRRKQKALAQQPLAT